MPRDEGEDKVTTLESAIRENVGPGMTLHFGGEPSAALREVLRQFWGQTPQFTLVSGTITFPYATSIVHSGLAKKVITSAFQRTMTSPWAHPHKTVGAMPLAHRVETENWSLYSIEQRLMAGALGLGFMPTKSIVGSDMAEENRGSFATIADPFDAGRKEGVVKALVPDLSLIHGCVADPYGNTILPVPCADALWGPRASRNGVVVTVEKLMSTDFIRKHPGLVRLPGSLVRAVCVAPLGAHPHGMVNPEVKVVRGYEADQDFLDGYNQAAATAETHEAWVKEWAIDCPSQEDYLQKLGYEKLLFLRDRARRDAWEYDWVRVLKTMQKGTHYKSGQMMLVAAAREIRDKVLANGYRTILSGAGSPGVAAWLVYHWLRERGYGVDLLWGLGRIGYMPLPGQTDPVGVAHSLTSKVLTDITEIYGVHVGGRNAKCISVLGAMQVDRFGNINNSRVGRRSLGSGGAGDAINANETVVVVKHSESRVLDRVSYVTCPGERVKTLVTSLGVFRKLGDDEEFTLTACLPGAKPSTLEACVRMTKERCGWDLKVVNKPVMVPPPTEEELYWLRLFETVPSSEGA